MKFSAGQNEILLVLFDSLTKFAKTENCKNNGADKCDHSLADLMHLHMDKVSHKMATLFPSNLMSSSLLLP